MLGTQRGARRGLEAGGATLRSYEHVKMSGPCVSVVGSDISALIRLHHALQVFAAMAKKPATAPNWYPPYGGSRVRVPLAPPANHFRWRTSRGTRGSKSVSSSGESGKNPCARVWRGKKDGMIAECQRADAETRRQRDTALARRGSDYADRLTAAVRDGRPGYRCFGWRADYLRLCVG